MSYWDRTKDNNYNPKWPDGDIKNIMASYERDMSIGIQWITEKLKMKGDPDFDLPCESSIIIRKRLFPRVLVSYYKGRLSTPSILLCRKRSR